MAFRVKDLVINVLPEAGGAGDCALTACTLGFSHCRFGSCDFVTICTVSGCRECSGAFTCIGATNCGGCTLNVTCGASVLFGAGGDVDPQVLVTLKAQLREALRAVESAEQLLAERMSPQSVDEVEALEQRLQGALEELKARKEQLRGREAGSDS
jgi:hypothetical protein